MISLIDKIMNFSLKLIFNQFERNPQKVHDLSWLLVYPVH